MHRNPGLDQLDRPSLRVMRTPASTIGDEEGVGAQAYALAPRLS